MSQLNGSHGYYGTPIYGVWASMVKRCENPNCIGYKNYGGRGISVDETWRKDPKAFCEWAIKNGYKKGLQLDRINNNGNYTPDNCHFVSQKENCAPGKRRTRYDNGTGVRNVKFSRNGKLEVRIWVNGHQKHIGTFKTMPEAIEARDDAEREALKNA